MEYSYRSLDPRDTRGDDVNFYLTGKMVQNDADKNKQFSISQTMLFNGVRGNIIYRQAIMRKPPNNGVGYIIDLAEITIPGGIIRIDRTRLAFEYELTLGNYGLPHIAGNKAVVRQFGEDGQKVITAAIPGRRIALIAYSGWDSAESLVHKDRNAEADESTVIFVRKKRLEKNPPMELVITVLLHRTDDAEWTDEELLPVKNIEICEIMPSGSQIGAYITLKTGECYEVDFNDIDGKRTC